MRSIVMIGPYPRYGGAIGGISIHIRRMRQFSLAAGLTVRVYQVGGEGCPEEGIYPLGAWVPPVRTLLVRERSSVVHSHMVAGYKRVIAGLTNALRGAPLLLTVHGNSLRDQLLRSALWRRLVAAAIRGHTHVIAVSPTVLRSIRDAGVPASRTSMLPAFVPPNVTDEDRAALPPTLRAFVERHSPVLAMSTLICRYRDEDLYGHDLGLAATARLRARGLNAGLVICQCRRATDAELAQQLMARADASDLRGHVHFLEPGYDLPAVLERTDVFLRPTRADGWGVSVAEAVYLGVPAVASNVCERVSGAYLFASADVDELEQQTLQALERGVPAGAGHELTYHEQLLDLYQHYAQQ